MCLTGKPKYLLFVWFCFCFTNFFQAQNTDSIDQVLRSKTADTGKLNLLFTLVETINDDNIWPKYNQQALQLSENLSKSSNELIARKGDDGKYEALSNLGFLYQNTGETEKALSNFRTLLKIQETVLLNETSEDRKIKTRQKIALALYNIAFTYNSKGDLSEAMNFYLKSQQQYESLDDKKGLARVLGGIGYIYNLNGDIPKALDYMGKALRLQEKTGDTNGIALSLNNIGNIYLRLGDVDNALENYRKSLKLYQEINYKPGIVYLYNNIGLIYEGRNNLDTALNYYTRSLRLQEDDTDKRSKAYSLLNMSSIYQKKSEFNEAFNTLHKCSKLFREMNDKEGVARCLLRFGMLNYRLATLPDSKAEKQKTFKLANAYSDSALIFSKNLSSPDLISQTELTLSKIDSATGNFNRALQHYKQFIIFRDSINNENTRKASIKSQLKYEFDKKEMILKEQQDKERVIAEEKSRFQQIVISAVIIGLLLVILFAAFILRSLKITKLQKVIIEEKQKEILDSIHYAKRIQTALMTNEKLIHKELERLQKP